MSYLWTLWLPIAFVAPLIWALESVLDLYLVHDVYHDEWDGTLISGAFMILPWLLPTLGILHFNAPPTQASVLALTGGALFLGSYIFYYRALFRFADSSLIHILWEVQVLVVPFLAWAWLNERLLPVHYLGIGLAFFGSTLVAVREGLLRQGFMHVAGSLFWAVLFFAGSMVVQKEAYRIADGQFFDVYLIFSLGGVLLAFGIMVVRPKITLSRVRRLANFKWNIVALLVISEIVSCGVIVFSQRAIDLSPSASFVAAIESTVPVFMMFLSLLLAVVFGHTRHDQIALLFRQQMLGWQEKLLAMALMSSGIYCIAG